MNKPYDFNSQSGLNSMDPNASEKKADRLRAVFLIVAALFLIGFFAFKKYSHQLTWWFKQSFSSETGYTIISSGLVVIFLIVLGIFSAKGFKANAKYLEQYRNENSTQSKASNSAHSNTSSTPLALEFKEANLTNPNHWNFKNSPKNKYNRVYWIFILIWIFLPMLISLFSGLYN